MKFGLTETEYSLLEEKVINPLKARKAKVFVFGSRATGRHKPFSDIDVLFTPSPDTAIEGNLLFLIAESIENSRLPYKVDIVNSNELAESYAAQIEKEKVEV